MIQKEKYNVKRVLALILSLACVTGLLAGCAQQNTSEGKADGSSLEEQTSATWYEIDQEAGILTVRLPAEKEGFIWNFTIDDTTLLELLTQEDNDGTFVASFRALGDGETVVSFTYARDDALEEIRALNVTCKDGKVADVSNASVMPISGQDDPEITDLRNSNSIWLDLPHHRPDQVYCHRKPCGDVCLFRSVSRLIFKNVLKMSEPMYLKCHMTLWYD